MLSTTMYEAARQFGLALREARVVREYRAAVDRVESDGAAGAILTALRDVQGRVVLAQREGQPPVAADLNELRRCQDAVRASAPIMELLRSQNALKAYLPAISLEVSGVIGVDFAALAASDSC